MTFMEETQDSLACPPEPLDDLANLLKSLPLQTPRSTHNLHLIESFYIHHDGFALVLLYRLGRHSSDRRRRRGFVLWVSI
jgi:hypothetical protein